MVLGEGLERRPRQEARAGQLRRGPRLQTAPASRAWSPSLPLDLSRVKAAVFDMDDTLLNWRQAEAGAIGELAALHFAAHGVAAPRVREVYDAVMAENQIGRDH